MLGCNLRYTKIVLERKQADDLGLIIDKDDSIAYGTNDSFALLIHGTQIAGSNASRAYQKIKAAKYPGIIHFKEATLV